jgi:hypothetical protein
MISLESDQLPLPFEAKTCICPHRVPVWISFYSTVPEILIFNHKQWLLSSHISQRRNLISVLKSVWNNDMFFTAARPIQLCTKTQLTALFALMSEAISRIFITRKTLPLISKAPEPKKNRMKSNLAIDADEKANSPGFWLDRIRSK